MSVSDRVHGAGRPRRVVLANLDVDSPAPPAPAGRASLDGPVTDGRAPLDGLNDGRAPLDALDDVVNGPADLAELLRLPVPAGESGDLLLTISPEDARRVRFFHRDHDGHWVRAFGASNGTPSSGTPDTEYRLPGGPGTVELRVEAVTLPGAPGFPAPEGRPAGEIQLELVREGGGVRTAAGTILLTIAPFLLISNLRPAEEIYVTYNGRVPSGNQHTIQDLVDAVREAHGDDAVPAGNAATGFETGPGRLLHVIDVTDALNPDYFPQDQFEMGYCRAPHAWMHMALHNPRERALNQWVPRELPGPDVGLFNALAGSPSRDSTDYGGNLELSPPVPVPTGRLPEGLAGPEVPPHPAAPLGKMIIGEARFRIFTLPRALASTLDGGDLGTVGDEFAARDFPLGETRRVTTVREGHEWWVEDRPPIPRLAAWRTFHVLAGRSELTVHYVRSVRPDLRSFLEAQGAQPILPVDTSWLNVGHVDE
ncbi:hypothetical protein ITP53_52770, partial [Nonomuraea sp. K274]